MCFVRSSVAPLCMVLVAAGLLAACGLGEVREPPVERDLAAIQARDTLVVLTTYNSTSYFLYRGEPLGYEYELLQAFAEDQDLKLRTVVVRGRDSLYTMLNRGVGDVVAARVIPMVADTAHVAFTQALYRTQPVLVQRTAPLGEADLPDTVDSLIRMGAPRSLPEPVTVRARRVAEATELSGRRVHLPGRSAYIERLVELSDSLTGDIEIVEVEEVSAEALIRAVARGTINLTVSQSNLAQLSAGYFSNLLIRPVVGAEHRVAWAVRPNAPELRAAFDAWIADEANQALFGQLYRKYFIDRQGYRERVASEYLTSETGRLSPYDSLFKQNADTLGWDWRLLASQAYQESRFRPRARSWAGAAGLLQLMPPTARQFGVTNPYDPADNVRGAVRFIAWLDDYWQGEVEDPDERLRFVLASYNTGHGHVQDARRLAAKHGSNPDVWEEVAYWLLQKSKRAFYTDPVVRYGFCRGLEPVAYVSIVLDRFDHYRQFVTA